ncbi:hypothetical protein PR048_003689, partial [Dryococelus australis]
MSPPSQIERSPEEQIRLLQLQITLHQITLSQQEDLDIRRLLWEQPQRFELRDDVVWMRSGQPNTSWKIWVLQQLRRLHHDHPQTGHPGTRKTLLDIKVRYSWDEISRNVPQYISNFVMRCRGITYPVPPPSARPRRPKTAWTHIATDLMGPYTCSSTKGNCYLLVVTDQFSRWVEAFPLPSQETAPIMRKINGNICTMGTPKAILTDDTQFTCRQWQSACQGWGVETWT